MSDGARTNEAGPIAPLTVRRRRRAHEPDDISSAPGMGRRTLAGARAADYARTLSLPRGRGDLARQLIIWFGFAVVYQLVRGLANRGPELAHANARAVIRFERGLHMMLELRLQHALSSFEPLITAANLTYWLSQFAVVGAALLWIYLRRYPWYLRIRDTIIVTNTIALIVYVVVPTAPPRLLTEMGFRDTLTTSALLNHGSGIVRLAENPYAAMPSLHTADALIIGVALALLVRRPWLRVLWVLWPPWVAFSLVVTGNHYLSDIVAGILLVCVAAPATAALERLRRQPPSGLNEAWGPAAPATAPRSDPREEGPQREARVPFAGWPAESRCHLHALQPGTSPQRCGRPCPSTRERGEETMTLTRDLSPRAANDQRRLT